MAWEYDTVELADYNSQPFLLGVIKDTDTGEVREIVQVESTGAGGLSGDNDVNVDTDAVAGVLDLTAEDPKVMWSIGNYSGSDGLTINFPDTGGQSFDVLLYSLDVTGLTLSVGGVEAFVDPEVPVGLYANDNGVPVRFAPFTELGDIWVAIPLIDLPASRVHILPGSRTVLTGDDLEEVVGQADLALAGKAPIVSPTFTGTVSGVSKSMVGLGSVDNVSVTTAGKGFVNHGSTAGTARPTGFASVEWYGTVEPSNAVAGDTVVIHS